MTNKELIDSAGRTLCQSIALTQDKVYTGYKLYTRWYGYYRLGGSVVAKFKLYRSNA